MIGDGFQRRMGNEFARVWQVAGNPCRGQIFQFAATSSSACPSPFLPFLYGEADSLWFLGCFRLCGFGRREFRGCTCRSAYCVWFGRLFGLAFGLWRGFIERIGEHWELKSTFKGSAYCPLVWGEPGGFQVGNGSVVEPVTTPVIPSVRRIRPVKRV